MMTRRIEQVGLDGALFERDVDRTLERVSKAGGLTIYWPIPRTRDALGHSGVQPWSAGAIFPATIATVERYIPVECHCKPRSLYLRMDGSCSECGYDPRTPRVYTEPSTSYRLTLDGHAEEYATWGDAERVALALLSDPRMRASWNADEDATLPGVDAYGVS